MVNMLTENHKKKLQKLAGIIPNQIKKVNFYILIGPPAIGKSTFIKTMPENTLVINRDDVVQQVASEYGLTYDDLFILPPTDSKIGDVVSGFEKFGKVKEAPEQIKNWAPVVFENIDKINLEVFNIMSYLFKQAKTAKYPNVVVDMTNMSLSSRSKILDTMQDKVHFRYIAVQFDISDPETKEIVKKASEIRRKFDLAKGIKKTIPDSAFNRMFTEYVPPSYGEGFDKIIKINTIDNLKKFIEQDSNNSNL
jgi:energy-coupling factor transporter ATP-binding protein EcfA2